MIVLKLFTWLIAVLFISNLNASEERFSYNFGSNLEYLIKIGVLDSNTALLLNSDIKINKYDNTWNLFLDRRFEVPQKELASLKQGASDGNVRAMYYYSLHKLFSENDCSEGLYWLEKAYQARLVMASVRLGNLHLIGYCGKDKSLETAISYLEIGLSAMEPESIFMLASLLRKGKYSPKQPLNYIELNEISAVLGYPIAQDLKGREYFSFAGSINYDLALGWLVLSYIQGNEGSLRDLILLHERYDAKITDEVKAIFRLIGKYRYYQFGYVDVFSGREFF